jgi:hypothetical protein
MIWFGVGHHFLRIGLWAALTPISQDVLELVIAKVKETQGSVVVRDRMEDRMNFSHVDRQLPPAGAKLISF